MPDEGRLWEEARELARRDDGPALAAAIARDAANHGAWHAAGLSLLAPRNLMSPRARTVAASPLMELVTGGGWPGKRDKAGNAMIDRIEALLVELLRRLFKVRHVEYRLPTGSIGNGLFLLAALRPGDAIMTLAPRHGGHLSFWHDGFAGAQGLAIHELPCVADGLSEIDLEDFEATLRRVRPRWIVLGSTRPLFPYPMAAIRRLTDGVGARILYDAAHVLGLAAGGAFQDPWREGADAVTATTHKTFPGPIGGVALMDDDATFAPLHRLVSNAIGNYHNSRAAALAVTAAEMIEFGPAYARAVVDNAVTLASALDARGFAVLGRERDYTRSHIVLVDLEEPDRADGAVKRLEAAGIVAEAVALATTYPHRAALRLGVQNLTRRGMGIAEMRRVATLLDRIVARKEDPESVGRDVHALSAEFSGIRYCFGPSAP